MGMAQPRAAGPLGLKARKTKAGTSAPASAATIGRVARRGSRRRPMVSSRLTSSPMTRKKMVMRASLTQCRRSQVSPPTVNSCCQSRW